jgi:hypothetical protein
MRATYCILDHSHFSVVDDFGNMDQGNLRSSEVQILDYAKEL